MIDLPHLLSACSPCCFNAKFGTQGGLQMTCNLHVICMKKILLVFSVLPPAQTHDTQRRQHRLVHCIVSPQVPRFYLHMFQDIPALRHCLLPSNKGRRTFIILRGLSSHWLTNAWLNLSTRVIHKMNRYPFNSINDPSNGIKCILGPVALIWHPLEDLFISISHTIEIQTPNSWSCRLQRGSEVSQYVGHHRAH